MDSLIRLQLVNLIKKYDYLTVELEVKSEISSISQGVFWQNIDRVLSGDPRLREMADAPAPVAEPFERGEATVQEAAAGHRQDQGLKSLYRRIAKLTHPDRVSNEYLNRTYVYATRCIRVGDRVGLYKAAVNLGLETEIPEGMADIISAEIASIEERIRFLDSSYHMRWHYSDKRRKIELVCEYIEKNLLRLS